MATKVPIPTLEHKFLFLGMKWRFLKKHIEDDQYNKIKLFPGIICPEATEAMRADINERILNGLQDELDFALEIKDDAEADFNDDSCQKPSDYITKNAYTKIPHASKFQSGEARVDDRETDFAEELQIALRNIQIFYQEKSVDETRKKDSLFLTASLSPRSGRAASEKGKPADKSKKSISIGRLVDHRSKLEDEHSAVPTPPLTSRSTPSRVSFNLRNRLRKEEKLIAEVDNSSAMAGTNTAVERAQNLLLANIASSAESIKAREQLATLEISEGYIRYMHEQGHRMPFFLSKIKEDKEKVGANRRCI